MRFANVSSSTATVQVYIDGVEMTGSPFTLAAGESTRQSFAGINAGPVKIVSDVPIVAAQRIIYTVNSVQTSYSETMGLPDSQLDTTFWFPSYNNVELDSQLRFANVSSSTATVRIYVGGVEMTSNCTPSNSPFTLAPGESLRVSCTGVNGGPAKIVSDVPIVAAQRIIYTVNSVQTSYDEMMGLPNSQLDTIYWMPWYNNASLLTTELILGVGENVQPPPVTIDYVYDPLNRLTEANYSTGDYYHYAYDPVGNRLTQNTLLSSLPMTSTYLYDDANRLTSVNGVTYTWDDNGNLLNDSVNAYTYDSANRLKTITGTSSATFSYNGLGDRLSQNGVNYALDLNAGLTQVLNDGTNTYLYGVDRIAQVNTNSEYFLGDALGSARQLTNTSGNVALTKSYAPYGNVAQSLGSAQTSYGFTGEFADPSGMMFLRARYYDPLTGRFTTKDSWMGDYNRPLSLNRWMYTEANPINYTDPSGHYPVCDCGDQGPIPDWWIKQLQIYIKGYGYIDPRHVQRGWEKGDWFIKQIEWALKMSYQYNLSDLGLPITIPLARAKSDERYWVDYAVSSNIDEEQKYGIAYGMYMDFERGYEEYQNSLWVEWPSGFAPADLPSDHLGFWAAMKEYKFKELPIWLQCLGKLEILTWYQQLPGGAIFDSNGGIPENRQFLPMIRETIDTGTAIINTTKNIAWPAWLEIQPIPSGPNTWQVLKRSPR